MNKFIGKSLLGLAVLALVVMVSEPVFAQGGGGRGFGRPRWYPKSRLATLPEVQTDLKLSDEQKTKITEIADQTLSQVRDLYSGGGGGEVDLAKLDQINQDASAKVDALLDAGQQKRLSEITIQVNGPAALNDPSVRKQLQFTDEQNKKFEEARQANQEAARGMRDLPREERQAKREELNKAADERLMALLTDQQKTEFEAMKGTPLTVDLSPLAPRGGGRRNN